MTATVPRTPTPRSSIGSAAGAAEAIRPLRSLDALWDQLSEGLVRSRYQFQHNHLARLVSVLVGGWHMVMVPGLPRPSLEQFQRISDRLEALLEADLAHVERGYYPRDLLLQMPIGHYLRLLPDALVEVPRMWWRVRRRAFDELPEGIDLANFPRYYRRTFHWQTDGWLSDHSARMYDLLVEFLFAGTADIMRRMAIPPVVDAVRELRQPRVLDVACGTGRFMLQLHRALPHAKLFGLDLSPFYIRYAGGLLNEVPDVSLVCDNAEAMPFVDASFDAVTSVYLFHELPRDARRNVAREMWRVLKPGGHLVLCVSAQRKDGAEIIDFLEQFPHRYHEPYYKGFLNDTLEDLLAEVGFEVESATPRFVSKIVVARRPA